MLVIIAAICFVIFLAFVFISDKNQDVKRKKERQYILNNAIADLKTMDNQVLLSIYHDVQKEQVRMSANTTNKAIFAIPTKKPNGSINFFLDLNNSEYFTYKKALANEIQHRGL